MPCAVCNLSSYLSTTGLLHINTALDPVSVTHNTHHIMTVSHITSRCGDVAVLFQDAGHVLAVVLARSDNLISEPSPVELLTDHLKVSQYPEKVPTRAFTLLKVLTCVLDLCRQVKQFIIDLPF